ncbi:glycine zipper 2TM domain-containing protein [Salinisphaera sp. USBA-960]|nr:glycine zipper 2TM domain-containing protein [Salifodinibacter halophilus]NNC27248.1 glycine zipper 2TM domain-containing protein [Salifodinibacter halophilus]
MTTYNITRLLTIALAGTLLAGCMGQRQANVDPIFKATPGSRYNCAYAGDNRNGAVKAAQSTSGQAAIGGILGGLLGNQFGSHTGRNIATGAGAAAGAAAGAYNAKRMDKNRRQNCLRRQGGGHQQQRTNTAR